jgi:uncharacterized protein (TIGR03066 family)
MKLLRLALVGVLALGVSVARADDKKDKETQEKLVGVWESVKGSETMPPGSTMELTKDGKIKLVFKQGEKSLTVEGTYKVDGQSFKATLKVGDKEHTETIKIKKLTDTELVISDEKDKTDKLAKKKPAKKGDK